MIYFQKLGKLFGLNFYFNSNAQDFFRMPYVLNTKFSLNEKNKRIAVDIALHFTQGYTEFLTCTLEFLTKILFSDLVKLKRYRLFENP